MTTLEDLAPIRTEDGLDLPFRRAAHGNPRAHVLLVHGASAASTTFTEPPPGSGFPNLVTFLHDEGFYVWTLDWRGSNLVVPKYAGSTARFTIDSAAEYDVPAAVREVRSHMKAGERLGVFAHCLGSGVLAAAIANGHLRGQVDRVVLSALGLFYASPWDGCVKVQDYIIEEIYLRDPASWMVDVGRAPDYAARFPTPMDYAYSVWPRALQIQCGCAVCLQVSFMFGHPYIERNLVKGIHDNATLSGLFNHMQIELYLHCGQNLRRGMYAKLDSPEDPLVCPKPSAADFTMPVTLITGDRNALWHRESIDRMYEWLRSHGKKATKHVISGFAHQDLLWGTASREEVFTKIAAGL